MPSNIPLSVPTLTESSWTYLKKCLDSGWVSSAGPFVTEFENIIAKTAGVPHAVALASGTAALHLALRSVGVGPGDLVVVSNLTFVASANAIRHCGADPIFIDAEPSAWQMDPVKFEKYLEANTQQKDGRCIHKKSGRTVRAVMPVHILGLACAMDKIVPVARRHNLAVVEDAAEAMGVKYQGKAAGIFGDAGVFSFNGNKIVTTGGGGAVVTADKARADRIRYWSTQSKDDETESYHKEVGFNYRLTSLQAALGLAQMESLGEFVRIKKKNAQTYAAALKDFPGITLMPTPAGTDATFWLYTFLLPERTTLEKRKAFLASLRESNIQARPFWHPLQGLPPFRDCDAGPLEVSEDLYARGISLPSSVGLTAGELDTCVQAVKDGLKKF